jgi:hypothetical protein
VKLDIEYTKNMLQVFADSEKAWLGFGDLYERMKVVLDDDEKFIFHYKLLCDDDLIAAFSEDRIASEGVTLMRAGNYVIGSAFPLRLTKNGVDFFGALNESEILKKLKTIPTAAFSVLKSVGISLLESYIKKQAGLE